MIFSKIQMKYNNAENCNSNNFDVKRITLHNSERKAYSK